MGKSFWTHSDHDLVSAMTKSLLQMANGESQIETRQTISDMQDATCDMLIVHESGRAVCLLQKWLGYNAKPEACRKYPFDGSPCFGGQKAEDRRQKAEDR